MSHQGDDGISHGVKVHKNGISWGVKISLSPNLSGILGFDNNSVFVYDRFKDCQTWGLE